MSNTTTGRVLYLDTFTSAITITNVKVFSIEWIPENVGDQCRIAMDSDDPYFIEWTCHTAFCEHQKYFPMEMMDLYIPAGGVGSGKVIIFLR